MIGRSVGRVVLRGTGDGSVVAAVATAAAGWGGPLRAAEGQRPGLGLLRRSALCSLSAAATAPTQSPSPVVVVRGREEKRDQDLEGRGRAQNARGRDWTDCTREQIKLQNRLNEIKELLLPAEERWKIASSVMQKAERDGFPLTRIHYGVALGICSRASQLQEALGYLQKIRNLNVGKLNSSNYLHAIVAAGKVADSTIVMDLYRGAREDDCVSLAVRCATMTALGKDGKWEEALELLRENAAVDIPDTKVYNAAITACAHSAQGEAALRLLQEMKSVGVPTSDVTYGAAMDACGRCGLTQHILPLLTAMAEDELETNCICYDIAIRGFSVHKVWEGTLEILRRARRDPCMLLPHTRNRLLVLHIDALRALSRWGEWRKSIALLATMRESGLPTDPRALRLVARALEVRGYREEVRELRTIADMYIETVHGSVHDGDIAKPVVDWYLEPKRTPKRSMVKSRGKKSRGKTVSNRSRAHGSETATSTGVSAAAVEQAR